MGILLARMNTALLVFILLGVLVLIALAARGGYAGPLDPPGPPGSTDGVLKPGIPISTLPYTISQPGNYYVTRDLTYLGSGGGITVNANNVTIDLGGFTLSGSNSGASNGIDRGACTCFGWLVMNGRLTDWGGYGLDASGVFGTFHDLQFVGNNAGAMEVDGGEIWNIHAVGNGGDGIRANGWVRIRDCLISSDGFTGIYLQDYSVVERCTVDGYTNGIVADAGAQIRDCLVRHSDVSGIKVGAGSRVERCSVLDTGSGPFFTAGWAIVVGGPNVLVAGNLVDDVTPATSGRSAGVRLSYAAEFNARVHGNEISNVEDGVQIENPVAASTVFQNRFFGVGIAINNLSSGANDLAPVVAGGAAASTNPWANILN